jgi:hypothetical protein
MELAKKVDSFNSIRSNKTRRLFMLHNTVVISMACFPRS